MKDVTNQLTDISINYEPAKISFDDFGGFKAGIEQAVARYSAIDLEVNSVQEVKQARTDLNKLNQRLEDRRKEINAEITKPYKDFKQLYDEPHSKLVKLISELKQQIDDFENHQKDLRKDVVRKYFAKMAEEGDLNPANFEQYLDDFVKASQFKKDSFELKKATIAELDDIVADELEKQNQRDADLMAIAELCAKHNFGPASYVRQYDNGATLAEIISLINQDAEKAEEFKRDQELKEQAKAEAEAKRAEEIRQQALEQANSQIKAYDADTGEVLEAKDEPKYTMTVKFWLDLKQAKGFKKYLDDNDIEFETVENMQEVKA